MKRITVQQSKDFADFWQNHDLNEDLKNRILSLMYDAKNLELLPEDWQWIYYNLSQWWGSKSLIPDEQIEYAIANYYTGITARTWTPNKQVNATISAIIETQLNLFS